MQECFQRGDQIISEKLPVFKPQLTEDGRASFWARYVKILRAGTSPEEALFAKIMVQDNLIMAFNDSGSVFNLISDTLYQQLGEPSQITMCNKKIKNGKMPVKGVDSYSSSASKNYT